MLHVMSIYKTCQIIFYVEDSGTKAEEIVIFSHAIELSQKGLATI